MKNDPVELALAALDEIPRHAPEGRKQIAKALSAKSNLVAAKAARMAGDSQCTDLTNELALAFERFRKRGLDLDKGCVAMIAIMRALYNLDYDGAELFLKGMRHVQMEPVWGGSSDTAAELRAICAMGLANTTYPGKLREIIFLLADREWQARAGAARAIAACGSEVACLLLRLKILMGDKEPEVLSDCFTGLLALEGADAIELVGSFADCRDQETRETAILALGASRRKDAVNWLIGRFEGTADSQLRKCILLSLAVSRTEEALAFLLCLIRDGSTSASAAAVSALEIHPNDNRTREEVEKALRARGVS